MPRCDLCRKKDHMINTCKFCESNLCMACLFPPKHGCKNIHEWKSKTVLSAGLLSGKCIAKKVDDI